MNLDKINKISWYRQETEGTPYFIYGPCCGCLNWFRPREGNVFWCCKTDRASAYLDKDVLRAKAEEYLEKEKKSPGSFENIFKTWMKGARDKNERMFKKIKKADLQNISDAVLLKMNKELADQDFFMWSQFFMDIYDLDAEGLVERDLVNAGIALNDKERNIMMTQETLLAHQRAERDLLKIIKLIKETPGAMNTFLYISAPSNLHRLKIYPSIQGALEEYQQAYFWLYNSWAFTRILTIFDFVDNIKQILSGPRDIEQELADLNNFKKNISRQKEAIADKYEMSEWLRRMFHLFGALVYWRDERKVQMQKTNHYLEALGREIGRRSGLEWHEVNLCDSRAISSIPVSRKLVKRYADLFRDKFMLTWDGKRVAHLGKKESAALLDAIERSIQTEVSEIRGMIACPGKVNGEVVVINKQSEFYKMEKGKVLVTVMTRPEFVPLMKKAAAIITDEGGITSHAAVISRELKVPCVIGTQIATKMLKDGDKVFVNADHGVVVVREN